MTVYALMKLDTSEITINGIDGDITVLLARTWDDNHNGTTALVTSTSIPDNAVLTLGQTAIVGNQVMGFNYGDAMVQTPYGVQGMEIISDSSGKDLMILHIQVKDEDSSTEDAVAFDTGLLGIHLTSKDGKLSYDGNRLYDVPGMGQNATVSTGFGSWAVYWVESCQPAPGANGADAASPYYRMRAAFYDSTTDLMTKAYTLVTFDPEKVTQDLSVEALHVYGNGTTTKVILEQKNEKEETVVSGFAFTEHPSLVFQHFALKTPAVKPGAEVSIYFEVRNDGNVPLTGFRLNILDGSKVRAYMDYSFVTA